MPVYATLQMLDVVFEAAQGPQKSGTVEDTASVHCGAGTDARSVVFNGGFHLEAGLARGK